MIMSVCIIAFIVLAFMGIFSAKYRRWAHEALDCVLRRLSLRPCRSSFNQKVKAVVTSKLMKRNRRLAEFAHRHFEAVSWAFTIILIVSVLLTANAIYNLALYGSCSPESPDQCVFNIESSHMECQQNCTPCWCDGKFVCDSSMPEASCEIVCANYRQQSAAVSQ